jgi:hypothetical protein
MDTKEVIARFEQERQAPMMDHPHIARGGRRCDSGPSVFVMELVRGIKITDYRDWYGSYGGVARAFIIACNAVQHAHQKASSTVT